MQMTQQIQHVSRQVTWLLCILLALAVQHVPCPLLNALLPELTRRF